MSEPETLAIIEEMRRFAKRHWMHDEGQNMRMFADRIEAIYKRELGNVQKMREVIEVVYDWILKAGNVHGYPDTEQKRRQLYDMMTKALTAPPRNCDVGTAEEQAKRFYSVCKKYKLPDDACEASCPMEGTLNCKLAWAQMPYEKEAR